MLRVPVTTFSTAMKDLEHLGTVVHSSSSATDVATQVIDVQQRLNTLRISLHDLNAFQRRATTIDQLLRFENAITQRRGQYQSLKAQRDHLVNQTSMSTINLDISVPPRTRRLPVLSTTMAGFLTGLRLGWDGARRDGRRHPDRRRCRAPLCPGARPRRAAPVVVGPARLAWPRRYAGRGDRGRVSRSGERATETTAEKVAGSPPTPGPPAPRAAQ